MDQASQVPPRPAAAWLQDRQEQRGPRPARPLPAQERLAKSSAPPHGEKRQRAGKRGAGTGTGGSGAESCPPWDAPCLRDLPRSPGPSLRPVLARPRCLAKVVPSLNSAQALDARFISHRQKVVTLNLG